MRVARAVIILLAFVEGLWMTFDGTRALTIGDYVTPRSRPGELGPWHYVVESFGIAPRSTLMKVIFVVFGVGWLIIAGGLIRRTSWALNSALAAAVLTLWYLPVGTAFGVVQIALLLLLRRSA
jgi:hypothetical protein